MKYSRLFLLLILIVFCTERFEKVFYIGFFDLYPARLLYLVLLLFLNRKLLNANLSKTTRKIFKYYFFFLLVVFISVFKSDDLVYSFKKFLDLFTLYTFILLVYNFFIITTKKNIPIEYINRKIINYLAIVVYITFIGGLFLSRIQDDGGSERYIFGIHITRRISLFLDPNFFAAFLSIIFFIFYFSKHKLRTFLLILILISLLLTGSKASIAAVILTFLFYKSRNLYIFNSLKIKLLLLATSITLFLFFVLRPIQTFDLLSKYELLNVDSGNETILPRILVWGGGFQALWKNPLLGVGPGNIVNVSKSGTVSNSVDYFAKNGFYGMSSEIIDKLATHNLYLEILFESGIIALSILIYIFYLYFRAIRKMDASLPHVFRGYYYGLIAFLICILSISYNPYYVSFIIGFTLFLHDKKLNEKI